VTHAQQGEVNKPAPSSNNEADANDESMKRKPTRSPDASVDELSDRADRPPWDEDPIRTEDVAPVHESKEAKRKRLKKELEALEQSPSEQSPPSRRMRRPRSWEMVRTSSR